MAANEHLMRLLAQTSTQMDFVRKAMREHDPKNVGEGEVAGVASVALKLSRKVVSDQLQRSEYLNSFFFH